MHKKHRTTGRFAFSLSDNYIAYRVADGRERVIRLHDLVDDTERDIARSSRFIEGPDFSGHTMAWVEHIPRDEFRPMGGHPLIDERDFRNLYQYDIRRDSKTELASGLFGLSRLRVGRTGTCTRRCSANFLRREKGTDHTCGCLPLVGGNGGTHFSG